MTQKQDIYSCNVARSKFVPLHNINSLTAKRIKQDKCEIISNCSVYRIRQKIYPYKMICIMKHTIDVINASAIP